MRSSSFLNDFAFETKKGSYVLIRTFKAISDILIVSKGRDKVLGLIQQFCDLYKNCMMEYIKTYRLREWPESVHNAHSLLTSIKSARKFIRLLKWVEEAGLLTEKFSKKKTASLILKMVRHFIGTFYFLIDNFIWFVQIGVIEESRFQPAIENLKDFMSLFRYFLRILIYLYTSHDLANEEEKLSCNLYNKRSVIKISSFEQSTLEKLVKTRQKRRFHSFEFVINVLRILMLFKSLKLPGSKLMSNIFKSTCGIVSGTFSLFKLLTRE